MILQRMLGAAGALALAVGAMLALGSTAQADTSVRFTPYPVAAPDAQFVDTCDGTLVHLSNGADATADAEFALTPELGLDLPVVLQPGHEPEPLLYPPDAGEITVTAGVEVWAHTWTSPGDCDEPTPSPTAEPSPTPAAEPEPGAGGEDGGDGDTLTPVGGADELPLTGSGLVLPLVALSGVAVVSGGFLMWAFRRRMPTPADE